MSMRAWVFGAAAGVALMNFFPKGAFDPWWWPPMLAIAVIWIAADKYDKAKDR